VHRGKFEFLFCLGDEEKDDASNHEGIYRNMEKEEQNRIGGSANECAGYMESAIWSRGDSPITPVTSGGVSRRIGQKKRVEDKSLACG
jgi:hypothetical protein